MIVSCPACASRIKLDRQKYSGKRIKLRCVQCNEIFHADVPPIMPTDLPLQHAGLLPQILVAHSDVAFCETVGEVLERHAFRWQACHHGDEALRVMEATPPWIALIDVALPGLFAFEVVEKVRCRPGLEDVKIILLSSVYNKLAYKRRPHSLYGADDYIEKHHIPTDLITKIERLLPSLHLKESTPPGSAGGGAIVKNLAPEELETIHELNNRLKQAEESEGTVVVANDVEAIEKARRLARIIASDIALYNQDKVEEGIRSGSFFELLSSDITEGRRHFLERIPPHVPGREEILQEAFESLIEHRRREMQFNL